MILIVTAHVLIVKGNLADKLLISIASIFAKLRETDNGAVRQVAWSDGPERIEREWWHDLDERSGRDYYRVELATGARLWIGRAAALRPDRPARWFLHGYLA